MSTCFHYNGCTEGQRLGMNVHATQEEVSVVGTKGKLEAFVPAHQRKTDDDEGGEQSGKTPNFRVGLRKLPWVDAMFPPEPAEVQEFYQGADADVLGAGYHEGATYFELEDFVRQERYSLLQSPSSYTNHISLRLRDHALNFSHSFHGIVRISVLVVVHLETFHHLSTSMFKILRCWEVFHATTMNQHHV